MDTPPIDVPAAGTALPSLHKGPYTSAHLVRWCAAQQNWDRIHYDADYAREVAGLKERVVNGALKQHLLVQLVDQAFGDALSLRRIAYRFTGPDFVGESLQVEGTVRSVEPLGGHTIVVVDLGIRNLDQDRVTTTGWAALASPGATAMPEGFGLDDAVQGVSGPVPAAIAALVGTQFESVVSAIPLDLGRLYLFADAVGGLRGKYFAPDDGGTPVAPPLFPIHALQPRPGALPLSTHPEALGREGVNEMGRNFGRRFGVPDKGLTNGGNDAEILGLLSVGETACATSTLLGAAIKAGSGGAPMLLATVLNSYATRDGRPLMRERQTTLYRNFEPPSLPGPSR